MNNQFKNKKLKIFLMAGTKDSVNILKFLKREFNSSHILATTTTKMGGKIAKDAGADEIIDNPLVITEIVNILKEKDFNIFIDSTHPFAASATSSAIESSKIANVPYIRFERPNLKSSEINVKNIHNVKSFEEAGKLIANNFKDKNILHLAGVNTIKDVLKSVPKEHFYVRVLPSKSSIEKCKELGIDEYHIIAMQGIFSKDFNKSLMHEFNAKAIVTKESGATGGVPAKLAAANELEIDIILVERPKIATLKEEFIVSTLKQLKTKINNLNNK